MTVTVEWRAVVQVLDTTALARHVRRLWPDDPDAAPEYDPGLGPATLMRHGLDVWTVVGTVWDGIATWSAEPVGEDRIEIECSIDLESGSALEVASALRLKRIAPPGTELCELKYLSVEAGQQ